MDKRVDASVFFRTRMHAHLHAAIHANTLTCTHACTNTCTQLFMLEHRLACTHCCKVFYHSLEICTSRSCSECSQYGALVIQFL